jgi:hypothetical protein
MKKNRAQACEYFSLEDLLSLMRQELDDAREEHDRLSDLLMRHYEDEDSDILEDYVDDLQDYVDEMEELTDIIDRLIDVRGRLSEDMVRLNAKFKKLGLL